MILRINIGAYVLNNETASALEALKVDRLLFRSVIDVQQGGIDAAVAQLANQRTPHLLIVETASQGDQLLQQLEGLANVCEPGTRVIIIGTSNDIDLYRTLIQYGVSDYLVGPAEGDKIRDSIATVFAGTEGDYDGRVIGFYAMAGGAGSSVIAHNVANELAAAYEEKVVVVDMDVCWGSAALNFNMQPRQTIIDALGQIGTTENPMFDHFFMPFGDHVQVLPSPASLTAGIQINQQTFDVLLKGIRGMGAFIVLDIPHVWDYWVHDAMAAVDDLVLISKPDLTNLRNAKAVVEYLGPKRGSDAPTRLVLNQVGAAKRADLGDKEFKEALALSPAASIPYDPEAFGRALNNGEMMSKAAAKSKATTAIAELAKLVGGREEEEEAEGKKKAFSLFKKAEKKKK